ncbi:MAG: glycosyltransferase family 1 protein [Prevotella sp.]|nr:glycosyltransferase family 1 protein [Candidatus Equicola faecalis]
MKILLITDEEWNDYVYGNNVLTNWFQGFDADFAQIYCSPGLPNNGICSRYFRITDSQMLKSIYSKHKAGSTVSIPSDGINQEASKVNLQRQGIYGKMKKLSLLIHTPVVMLRDAIWGFGRYDKVALKKFIDDFSPDVVYCPRLATPKLLRLERLVHTMTNAPFIAFTADDEASYTEVNYSPLYWLRRWYCHRALKKTMPIYKEYLMFSKDQAKEYTAEYGIKTGTLYKCGVFPENFESKPVGRPIRLVYAGKLYCNRWKSLAAIGEALHEINKNSVKMILDIYTPEQLTKEQGKSLCEENHIYVKGSVLGSELARIYKEADIALHVESFDKKYKYATRVSFSTKIIDLMASSCAIMAICWNQHTGYQYLKEFDAAICIDSYDKILRQLQRIVDDPDVLREYAKKAYECGKKNHSRDRIQNQLKTTFEKYIIK